MTPTPYDGADAPAGPARDPFLGATVWTIDPVLKKITDALAALGPTSAAVGRRLAAMRCKGERGNPCYCPLVSYLRRQPIGRFELRLLSGGHLEVSARDGWVEPLRLPPACEFFLRRFDRGEFPACAAEGSHAGDGFPRPDWAALYAAEDAALAGAA